MSWNDFLWPLIIINTDTHAPLQLGLATLQSSHFTAGLEKPASGVIRIGDRVVNEISARDRDIAMAPGLRSAEDRAPGVPPRISGFRPVVSI